MSDYGTLQEKWQKFLTEKRKDYMNFSEDTVYLLTHTWFIHHRTVWINKKKASVSVELKLKGPLRIQRLSAIIADYYNSHQIRDLIYQFLCPFDDEYEHRKIVLSKSYIFFSWQNVAHIKGNADPEPPVESLYGIKGSVAPGFRNYKIEYS